MLRVGIVLNFNKDGWRGGYEYIKNLLYCLKKLPKTKIKPIIITDHISKVSDFKDLKPIKIIKTNHVKRTNIYRMFHKILLMLFNKNIFFENFLKKNKIDVMSHFYFLGNKSFIKSLNWIPDFQEINTPEYLDFKKILFRKFNLYLASKHSSKILLSSNTVKKDLKKISKEGYNKSVVIKPFFSIIKKNQLITYSKIKKKYNINKNYFFLPNQYWIHKNHFLVLKCLKELKKKNKNLLIVSTGIFNDFRYPEHKSNILNYIKKNNLEKNYKILGIIPFRDLLSLMYYSIALINPSKSEGWSSTVEQGKSYGKMILLSNIKVHKEQAPKRSFYFNPNKTRELSKKLLNLSNKFNLSEEIKIIGKEFSKNKINEMEFAKKYENLICSI